MLIAMGASYLVDAALFALYALAGATTFATPIVYGICGVTSTLVFLVLSETGFNDRFADHYLTLAQGFCASTIMLGGVYFAPEVGLAFCFIFFLVFGFATLRTTAWQAATIWTYATIGLAAAILLADKPIGLPTGSWAERVATLLFLITSLGRCISMGLFAIAMREALYKRGKELKAAYERIEELAQLDELTGALNRRFVMKELDDELLRCMRSNQPCAVALIDLDWFKKINDTFGHPAGDEALQDICDHDLCQHPRHRQVRPLRRRGIPADHARHAARRGDQNADRLREIDRRSRLGGDLPEHDRHPVRGRHVRSRQRHDRHRPQPRRPGALPGQGSMAATASMSPDLPSEPMADRSMPKTKRLCRQAPRRSGGHPRPRHARAPRRDASQHHRPVHGRRRRL